MKREILISIIILILIICLDIKSNNYTKNTVNIVTVQMEELRNEIKQKNSQVIEKKIKEINDTWKEKSYVLSYYIEHDELEKVETEISILNGCVLEEMYDKCFENIDKIKYILSHIENKEKLNGKSIF